jgi:hypothetical protein
MLPTPILAVVNLTPFKLWSRLVKNTDWYSPSVTQHRVRSTRPT